ncbi:efflux RND transporter permease subunit [Pseudomonas cichorii]|nr:efflux RND transporter permease subunit [Pseudomonas cichorii]MBX8546306.1 efflux RND transporter permease subunit [Pseudomonas cichorii]MBX8562771.1 efflux RND transporter permease subunit [Pseudomonas cichorii]MBX8580827.1 efflux RND transporter permease subunit [Pseudomonas cichorii]MBX8590760.1 efflux RND transporter permease subunit [Pseudomonas cichorii]
MTLSSLSIRFPVPALMLFILLGVLGFIGLQRLGIQDFPDLDLPTVTISASLEGAAPEQLETEVARKLEDRLSSLRLLKHVTTTITSGNVQINVSFAIEKDGNEALNEVRNVVDSAMAELPASLETPSVSRMTIHDTPVLTYVIDAPGMDEEALSWFVDNELSKHLQEVKGVAQVLRVGGVEREVQVDLDPTMMAGLGLGVADVETQLKAMEIDNSGGMAELGGARMAVRTLGGIEDPQALGAVDVPTGNGRSFALRQLATIRDHHAERHSLAFLDGKPVIGVQVIRSLGFSDVSMASGIREAVADFVARQPGISLTEISDSSASVLENYHDSMNLLYEGILLAVLVVWWFLRDPRAMLIVATALPLSIIPTFGLMYFAGFTLNTVSLLALALIIGILVDDAIVEVENIARHLRMGKSPREAAMEAADEIGLAVIATTVTLVAVFLPTAFMGGVAGKLFVQFGVTASAALLFSLMVARLLTPMMAAAFLKPVEHVEEDGWLMRRYLVWIHRSLEWRKTTMALAGLFFAGSLALIGFLPTSFLPAQDIARSTITLELPPGATLEQTASLARDASARLKPIQGIRHIFAMAGTAGSDAGDGATVNRATLTVELARRQDRELSQTELEARMRDALRPLPGARISVGGDGNGEKLDIVLASEDGDLLERTALALEPQLRQLSGVGNIASSASLQAPEVQFRPDYTRAAQLGVTSQQIADTLRLATYGSYSSALGKINLSQRQVNLRVRMSPDLRGDLERIGQLRVNGQVALASLGELSTGSGPAQIDRLDRQRYVTLSVELNGRSLGEVMNQARQLPGLAHLPAGVRLVEQGEVQLMSELFGSFGLTMAIGVFCIYAVLVLLFHDFLQPATILSALPLSLGGALLGLLACDLSFSLSSVIGLLMLMGIVTKNSILLVDYAILARRDFGMSRYDALLDACHKRARPILMTTIAMGAGMLPTAIGVGADPGFRQPMAVVVIGGLLTSTVLSLLVIPVIFTYVDDLLQLFKRATKAFHHGH